jgi:hypothetical protein
MDRFATCFHWLAAGSYILLDRDTTSDAVSSVLEYKWVRGVKGDLLTQIDLCRCQREPSDREKFERQLRCPLDQD